MVVRDIDRKHVRLFATQESAEAWVAQHTQPERSYPSLVVQAVEVYP